MCPREWLFDNVVVTEVIVDDENGCLKFFLDDHDHLGEVQQPLTASSRALNKGCHREWNFGDFVVTKVMGDDGNSNFQLFPDIHDHLGEFQHL